MRHMKSLMLILFTCVISVQWMQAKKHPITTFDPPGEVWGTYPVSINSIGMITGYYKDASVVYHGFTRASDGTFIEFDAPGAGTGQFQGTFALSINDGYSVAGYYEDANTVYHGFMFALDGLTEFDAPGAGTAQNEGTTPMAINSANAITGFYQDKNMVYHGFLRTLDGTFTDFDAPGAGTGQNQGTRPTSINSAGAITGEYADANGVFHGFLRAPNGTFTEFDAPYAYQSASTFTGGINSAGTIAGLVGYGGADTGFLRAPDGTITEFVVLRVMRTSPQCINDAGTIAGTTMTKKSVYGGFVRAPSGTITKVNVPAAGKHKSQGTWVQGINKTGVITGYYTDANGLSHGYLRQ